MKNIKKIVSAISIFSAILIGSIGANAVAKDEQFFKQLYNDQFIDYELSKYAYAWYCDDEDKYYFPMSSLEQCNFISISLAEPIVCEPYRSYADNGNINFDYKDNIISGYLPTVQDFPELEGITDVAIYPYEVDGCITNGSIDGQAVEFVNFVCIEFKNSEQALNAYYKLNLGNNPIVGGEGLSMRQITKNGYEMVHVNTIPHFIQFGMGVERPKLPEPVYGDVNKDGKVTTKDLILEAKYISGKLQDFGTLVGEYQADYNQDGVINSEDLLLIIKKLIGEI